MGTFSTKTMTMIHDEDIVESVLEIGVLKTSYKYNISADIIREIAKRFTDDLDDVLDEPCSCEKAWETGIAMMCFMCDRRFYRRL